MQHVDWEVLGIWVGSLGTVAAVSTALVQVALERRARHAEGRREQADLVSAWIAAERPNQAWLAISNESHAPVYEVALSVVSFQGAGPTPGSRTAWLSIAPPGLHYASTQRIGRGMSFHPGIELAFTDQTGRHWVRQAKGNLQHVAKASVEHYGHSRPLGWQIPAAQLPAADAE